MRQKLGQEPRTATLQKGQTVKQLTVGQSAQVTPTHPALHSPSVSPVYHGKTTPEATPLTALFEVKEGRKLQPGPPDPQAKP
jgi:hypothetical protein